MRLHRSFAALLQGLPMAAPIAVVAEDAPLAPEVQRRVAVVVLARRIRGYAALGQGQQRLPGGEGASFAPPGQASPGDLARGVGISRRVLVNPLVVAVTPRLQHLLDDRCALDPTEQAEALQLARNEL